MRKFMRTNQIVIFHRSCHVIGRANGRLAHASFCFLAQSRPLAPCFTALIAFSLSFPLLSSSPSSLLSFFHPFFPLAPSSSCSFVVSWYPPFARPSFNPLFHHYFVLFFVYSPSSYFPLTALLSFLCFLVLNCSSATA